MAVPGGFWQDCWRYTSGLGVFPWLRSWLRPADWAAYGTRIGPFRAYVFQILAPILMATPATKANLCAPGYSVEPGRPDFTYQKFAAVLDQLATSGADLLHRGELGEKLIQGGDCQQRGGII